LNIKENILLVILENEYLAMVSRVKKG